MFLEEAQHLDEAGLFVKGLVDRHPTFPIIVTGSSSYHLRARTRESLAGRSRRARIFPLSLVETCSFQPQHGPALRDAIALGQLDRHLVIGGYPAVWNAERPLEELSDLLDAFVLRDASDLFRIQRPEAFRMLLQLAARQVGSAVNLSEWASLAGVSVPTVSSYLSFMEEAHLLALLPAFAGGKRAELTQAPKAYFIDNGLRNRLVGDFSPFAQRADRGQLLENWVYSELHKALPFGTWIGWWRTRGGAEVDFVIREQDALVGVEVKAGHMRRPRLSKSARSFVEAYRPTRFLVVNSALEHQESAEGVPVTWCTPVGLIRHIKQAFHRMG